MSSAELSREALELPAEERLELVRRLVESEVTPDCLNEAVMEGVRRIEDLASGKVKGLTEEQYRAEIE